MKKISYFIIDHAAGVLAAIIYYSLTGFCLLLMGVLNLFKREKKVKPQDKKMFFNDPFEFAHFQKKKKRFI